MIRKAVIGLSVGAGAGVLVSMRRSVEEELTHPHKLVTTLQENKQFTRFEADPQNYSKHTSTALKALAETGGLSESHVFIERSRPEHTITYVYAGSRTVGFPFLVHGGILGTLLTNAFDEATGKKWSKIDIQYKRPTLANQFLVIETKSEDKHSAEIRDLKGKLLVTANAS